MKTNEKKRKKSAANQVLAFRSGNEMAAEAAAHIDFHVMGFYPITPSTEVAETLDSMKADGEHEIRMIAGDGEHGAKEAGRLRLEGKEYIVKEGDVMHFRFNV